MVLVLAQDLQVCKERRYSVLDFVADEIEFVRR